MSRADAILLVIAAYVAVITLVRLMKSRRDALVADVQKQVAAHRRRVRKAASKAAEEDRNAA